MRRTTTRSPSGRNFIGILFGKFLKLMGYLCGAALVLDECQHRNRYLGSPGGRVKRAKGRKGRKVRVPGMNSQSASRPFQGISPSGATACRASRCSSAVQPIPYKMRVIQGNRYWNKGDQS